jgi:hypothetical protein
MPRFQRQPFHLGALRVEEIGPFRRKSGSRGFFRERVQQLKRTLPIERLDLTVFKSVRGEAGIDPGSPVIVSLAAIGWSNSNATQDCWFASA